MASSRTPRVRDRRGFRGGRLGGGGRLERVRGRGEGHENRAKVCTRTEHAQPRIMRSVAVGPGTDEYDKYPVVIINWVHYLGPPGSSTSQILGTFSRFSEDFLGRERALREDPLLSGMIP